MHIYSTVTLNSLVTSSERILPSWIKPALSTICAHRIFKGVPHVPGILAVKVG